jgi:hypothetical protein
MQSYTSSKEEAEYWNDSNSKLVFRLCETWLGKGVEQLERWSTSTVLPTSSAEIVAQAEPEKKGVHDLAVAPKEEPLPKAPEYVPSFGQDLKRTSLTGLKNTKKSSIPLLSHDTKKSIPRLTGEIKRSTNALSQAPTRNSIPLLANDGIRGSIPILGAPVRESIVHPAQEVQGTSTVEEKRGSILKKPGLDSSPAGANLVP